MPKMSIWFEDKLGKDMKFARAATGQITADWNIENSYILQILQKMHWFAFLTESYAYFIYFFKWLWTIWSAKI